MPRDYAKKSSNKRKSSRNSATPGWLWFVTIVLIVAFISGLIYLHKHKWRETRKKLVQTQQVTQNTAATTKNQAPRFEFYSMLSKNNAPATAANNETAQKPQHTAPVITIKPLENRESYLVQIASFSKHQQAEELKAKLLLQGMTVSTLKLSHDDKSWYRVVAGPYKDLATAQRIKTKLAKAGYKVILRKLSPK